MIKIGRMVGTFIFIAGLPALWVYLRASGKRTRVLLICDDEFLVVKGWLGIGDWALPGGGLHNGENSLQGLIREVQEETGIALYEKNVRFLWSGQHSDKGIRYDYDCFEVKLDKKPTIKLQRYEIAEYAWVPIKNPDVRLAKDVQDILGQWKLTR